MTDQVLMHVLNTADDLPKIKFCLLLSNFVVLNEVVEFSFWSQFHNDEDVICRIENLIQLDDVWMVDELENLDFTLYFRYHVLVFHFFLVYYFYGNLNACEIVFGLLICHKKKYIWLWRTLQSQSFCQECSGRCVLITWNVYIEA